MHHRLLALPIVFATLSLPLVLFLSSAGFSQGKSDVPRAFDAASIRSALPSAAFVNHIDPVHLTLHSISLLGLIEIAYGLSSYQVEAPSWMEEEDFSIDAETQHPATKSQMDEMLRQFLIRQFGLATHLSTKMENVYGLEVTDSGFKLKPEQQTGPAQRYAELRSQRDGGSVLLEVRTRGDLDYFANALSPLLGRPVVNDTTLKGIYSFDLKFTPAADTPDLTPDARSALEAAAAPGPSLFAALPEQLGLKLVARKGPITVLVIDHATKLPLGN